MATATRLSKQEVMGAKFRMGIRAAGGPVEGDEAADRRILAVAGERIPARKDQPESEVIPLPAVFDIEPAEPEHAIRLRKRDGSIVTLRSVPTLDAAIKLGWVQASLVRLGLELELCQDEAQADELIALMSHLRHASYRACFPDMPDGLLNDITPSQAAALDAAMERIGRELVQARSTTVGKIKGLR